MFKENGHQKIVNHIYPDVDRHIGIEIDLQESSKKVKRNKTATHRYREFQDTNPNIEVLIR